MTIKKMNSKGSCVETAAVELEGCYVCIVLGLVRVSRSFAKESNNRRWLLLDVVSA